MTLHQLTRRAFVKTMTIGATAVMILKWPPPAEGRWGVIPCSRRRRRDGDRWRGRRGIASMGCRK